MAVKSKQKAKPSPTLLSHYSTLHGLSGVVSDGKIWASNVSFLNDHRELEHGIDATFAALATMQTDGPPGVWAKPLEAAEKALRAGKVPDTYAACFCESSDLLSQWRGYGGQVQGVSISFSRTKLKKALGNVAVLQKVTYCDLTARQKMKAAIEAQLGSIENIYELVGLTTDADRKTDAFEAICTLLPRFKHVGFSDEREWRFVVQGEKANTPVKYRVSGNVIVPYVELGPGGHGSLPIQKVTIGPGKNQDLTAKSVTLFLRRHGYPDVKVVKSKVPFRT
mgnify:CR=1 FL=1